MAKTQKKWPKKYKSENFFVLDDHLLYQAPQSLTMTFATLEKSESNLSALAARVLCPK